MPPAFANTKNIGKREGTLWGEHEDKILYRAGIDQFFKKQDEDRREDKKKFQMHSIKSITSEEEVVNATIRRVSVLLFDWSTNQKRLNNKKPVIVMFMRML